MALINFPISAALNPFLSWTKCFQLNHTLLNHACNWGALRFHRDVNSQQLVQAFFRAVVCNVSLQFDVGLGKRHLVRLYHVPDIFDRDVPASCPRSLAPKLDVFFFVFQFVHSMLSVLSVVVAR